MNKGLSIVVPVIFLNLLAGCGGNKYLQMNFEQSKTQRYKFVSSRDITVNLAGKENPEAKSKGGTDKFSESMEMIVAYTPVEVNNYGVTKIKAICESVTVKRTGGARLSNNKDAIENLTGKSFIIGVGPTGKIEDYSDLRKLISEIGEKAFRAETSQGRIKEPDMICDFVASQWFLWDSISTHPLKELRVGDSWTSKLSVCGPMVLRVAREVSYKVSDIRDTQSGKAAVIESTYSKLPPEEKVPASWPVPYSGSFRMSGTFGLLGNYQIVELSGSGQELVNLDKGTSEGYSQKYHVQMTATFPFGLGLKPVIDIDQELTMELLK